jgi:hypothetical protein
MELQGGLDAAAGQGSRLELGAGLDAIAAWPLLIPRSAGWWPVLICYEKKILLAD